ELVNVSGDRVMGWGVDAEFAVNRSTLVPITIPVGQLRIAEATRTAQLNGTLNNASNSVLATSGSRFDFGALTDTSGPISNTSLVTNLRNAGGSPIGVVGSTITLDGARTNATGQGSGTVLPDSTLTITATTTVNDLLSFINQGLRITTGGGANPDGFTPGATLNAGTGVISIVGNTGRANNLQFDSSNFVVTPPGGGAGTQPLTGITNIAQANGESTRTTRPVFDSLGNNVSVEVTVTLVSRGGPNGGSTWRYEVTSPDDTDGDPRVASGLINFDENGRYLGEPGVSISINRQAVGAAEPLTFTLDFSRVNAAANPTAGAAGASNSSINFAQVDGSPLGTLTSFAVGADGTISGSFDNGRTRTIGQVALATFSNPEGLVDAGQNLYGVGANSGNPQIVIPGDAGAGGIVGGSLELSNVDLSNEFINLILSSTGYSAASRVISTSDQLLQQLLVIGR
nr:flagellar hook-basal body complex protein [Phycisphaerales bacterium]